MPLPEFPLQNFSGRISRQHIDKFNLFGNFKFGQFFRTMGQDLLRRQLPPFFSISLITFWADSRLISPMTISAPSSAKALAVDSPIPIPPPVTTATFPATGILAPFGRFTPTLFPDGKGSLKMLQPLSIWNHELKAPPPENPKADNSVRQGSQISFRQRFTTQFDPRNIFVTPSKRILGPISSDWGCRS